MTNSTLDSDGGILDTMSPVLVHAARITTSPAISLLVRVRNEAVSIPEFWRRLREQTVFEQTEIIFLDSGSTDGTLHFLMQQPCLVYRISADTFNFGRSCNQLAELATAPIMMLISGHVLLADHMALQRIAATLDISGREAAYVRQVPNPIFGYNAYEAAYLAKRFPPGNHPRRMLEPGGFSNAASAFTRVAWEAQRFPETHGSEDYLWALDHLKAGGRLYYLPHVEVLHSHAESAEAVYRRVRLNVQAKSITGSYGKALFMLIGIFLNMVRKGASLREASNYAYSHAKAYL
jgi:glycosyltransferase involved in cell wall biosynthesis